MTADDVLAALNLPQAALVNRRVPKTLLLEHGAPTAADRRKIREGVEQVQWVAAIKPTTAGVAEYRDETREILEITVLHLSLRPEAKLGRLVHLVHRAVPYLVVAVTEQAGRLHLSLAPKRRSQGESGKVVLDGDVVSVEWQSQRETYDGKFLAAIGLGNQPASTLLAVYQGWIDTLIALEVARLTGTFHLPGSPERRAARRELLAECTRLDAQAKRLRAAAAREKQMGRKVELNLELKQTEAKHAEAMARL